MSNLQTLKDELLAFSRRIGINDGGRVLSNPSFMGYRATIWALDDKIVALTAEVKRLREALEEAKGILFRALPALGLHARGSSQEALIRACTLVGANPEDWTQYPDVMEQRRSILEPRAGGSAVEGGEDLD